MTQPTAYDQVAYPEGAFDYTHPRRIGAIARLFGLSPAPPERCRVLELGCGQGKNLLPMAEAFPESTFVGIDLAAKPIAEGDAMRQKAGVPNLTLRAQDVMDFEPEPGGYDYIIAHGLYAWVPPAVQDRVMAVIAKGLSAHGVAYVSYNTLPGSHLRRPLRDLMRFHAGRIEDPKAKMTQARAIAQFVGKYALDSSSYYKTVMERQQARIEPLTDEYLFHDDMSDAWSPLYFHEFMGQASQHGLAYLGDAFYDEMQDHRFPEEVRRFLRGPDDVLLHEQYLDFIVGRSFRRTLLVRGDAPVDRTVRPEAARAFFYKASPPADGSTVPVPEPGAVDELGALALRALHAVAPAALSFDEVVQAVRAARPSLAGDVPQAVGAALLAMFAERVVQCTIQRPRVAARPGLRPRARALTRLQAELGPVVTDLWHENDKVDDVLALALLRLADGTRDRAAMRRALGDVRASGRKLSDAELDRLIDERLNLLAKKALLEV